MNTEQKFISGRSELGAEVNNWGEVSLICEVNENGESVYRNVGKPTAML